MNKTKKAAPAKLLLIVVLAGAAMMLAPLASLYRLSHSSAMVVHTIEVEYNISRLLRTLIDAETGMRGYLATSDPEFLDIYYRAQSRWHGQLEHLRDLTSDNPAQQENLRKLNSLIDSVLATMQQTKIAFDRGERGSSLTPAMKEGKDLMDHARVIIRAMQGEETRLALVRQENQKTDAEWTTALLVLTSFTMFGIAIAMWRKYRTGEERTQAAIVESEERLRLLTDNIRDYAIIMIDPRGRVVSWNEGARRLKGYAAEEIIGQPISVFYTPEDISAGLPASLLGQAELQGRIENEGWRVRKDGSRFYADVIISVIRDETGNLIGFAKITRDITERKRIERMKNEFVSTVSHELRTPLTSISGALGLIAGGALGELPEQMHGLLDIASKNSIRLTQLINDLLDIEKIVAGQLKLDMQAQPLMPLVEQALDANRSYGDQYKVHYTLKERADGVEVKVDGGRLMQVLANFLSNAAKFSPEGGEVEVLVHREDDRVRVSVRDHGQGIPEEFRGRMFQKFSQADSSDTRAKGGTGLGLAITKELAERMGSRVGYDSEAGNGATFFIDLPVTAPTRHG